MGTKAHMSEDSTIRDRECSDQFRGKVLGVAYVHRNSALIIKGHYTTATTLVTFITVPAIEYGQIKFGKTLIIGWSYVGYICKSRGPFMGESRTGLRSPKGQGCQDGSTIPYQRCQH